MPLLTPSLIFQLGPDYTPDELAALREDAPGRSPGIAWGMAAAIGAFGLFASGFGSLGLFALLFLGGLIGMYVMSVFSGARVSAFAGVLSLLALTYIFATAPLPGGSPAAGALGFGQPSFRLVLIALMAGLVLSAAIESFLRESTIRGARLIMPRWRGRNMGLLVLLAWLWIGLYGALFLAWSAPVLGSVSLCRGAGFLLAALLAAAPALILYALSQRILGSAGLASATAIAWVLVAGLQIIPGIVDTVAAGGSWTAHFPESLGALLLALTILAHHLRRPIVFAGFCVATFLVHPPACLVFIALGLFLLIGRREGERGGALIVGGCFAAVVWAGVATLLGEFPPELASIAQLQHTLLGSGKFVELLLEAPIKFVFFAPLLLPAVYRPSSLLMLAPLLLFAEVGANGASASPVGDPVLLVVLFYAAIMGLQMVVYRRPFRAMDTRSAFLTIGATPEAPPPPELKLAETQQAKQPKRVAVVPRPWTVQQAIALRAAVPLVLAPYAFIVLARLLGAY